MRSPVDAIVVLVAMVITGASAGACPTTFENSLKVGSDRNGGEIEVDDLIDWTLTIINDGCHAGADSPATVTDVVDPQQEFVNADRGGQYDAATRTVTWGPATTPELVSVPALGGTVVLSLTTRVTEVGVLARACNRASVASYGGDDLTDDPSTPAVDDPTCIPAFAPFSVLDVVPCLVSGAGGDMVAILGSGFDGTETVSFGSIVAASATELIVEAAPGESRGTGQWVTPEPVAVTSPYQTWYRNNALVYTSGNPATELRMVKRPPWELELQWQGGPWNYVLLSDDPTFACGNVTVRRVGETWLRDGMGYARFYRVE